ncbi:hypothetical protein E2C01_002667 [Portunus trituberculatus]|uniref:Uncharacterized protein n=1 Tax=Portunus trituberculatus TaxID=210409 RepID=A0A5B7CK19_PORTR|nr:hypothetical protein [Portunus trituberculatus]
METKMVEGASCPLIQSVDCQEPETSTLIPGGAARRLTITEAPGSLKLEEYHFQTPPDKHERVAERPDKAVRHASS